MTENVNHPDHYKAGNLEVIDIIEEYGLDFHLGNAVKYILRAGRKTEDPIEDLEKAVWYIQRFLDYEVRYTLTPKGEAVAELIKAGFQPPIVERLGLRTRSGFVWELTNEGAWYCKDLEITKNNDEIVAKLKISGGDLIDLGESKNETVEAPEPTPRQKAIDLIKAAGYYVPDSNELFYVNPNGVAWELNGDGEWRSGHSRFSTADVIRYLGNDGGKYSGTIRSSSTADSTVKDRASNPTEGTKVVDSDGDDWEFKNGSWYLFGESYNTPYSDLPDWAEPYRLPDEKGDE